MLRCCAVLLFAFAPFCALAAPVPKENDTARMLRIYGTVHDPDKDTEFKPTGESLQLKLPAEKRVLRMGSANAPRVWREVRGDFTVTVRVSFAIRADIPRKHDGDDEASAGAGLVVWDSADNFLALRRDEQDRDRRPKEWFRDQFNTVTRGVGAGGVESKSAYLRVVLKGKVLDASYSSDGKEWRAFLGHVADWGDTVKVGVFAENSYKAPFEVVFDEYSLTQPKK